MSGLLKDVMEEQARAAGAPHLDPARIVRDGDRRVRRNRTVALAGAAATVTALVGGAALLDRTAEQPPEVVTDPGFQRALSWASDNRIHVGDEVLRASGEVRSYVLTDTGPVWTTPRGDVVTLQDEQFVFLGRTSADGYYLKADDTGSLVAWMEFPASAAAELVVYDTARREEVLRTSEGTRPGMSAFRDTADAAYVYAVDDGSVYWHNLDGAVRTDVATGDSAVLGDVRPFAINDVAAGQLAYTPPDRASSGESTGMFVGPALGEGRDMGHHGNAFLSRDATYISFEEADELFVVETATGRDVTPALPGYDYAVVFDWLDDDTAAVYGIRSLGDDWDEGRVPVRFLTCELPEGTCTEQASDSVDPDSFALPFGEYIGG